jgi:hypothetical protein
MSLRVVLSQVEGYPVVIKQFRQGLRDEGRPTGRGGEFSGGSSSFTVPSWAPGSSELIARWSARVLVGRDGRDVGTCGDFTIVISSLAWFLEARLMYSGWNSYVAEQVRRPIVVDNAP